MKKQKLELTWIGKEERPRLCQWLLGQKINVPFSLVNQRQ